MVDHGPLEDAPSPSTLSSMVESEVDVGEHAVPRDLERWHFDLGDADAAVSQQQRQAGLKNIGFLEIFKRVFFFQVFKVV